MLVALVVLSAFLHAAWNALLKREPDKDTSLIAAVAVATALAIVVAGLRWAVAAELPFASITAVGWALVAGALELAYFMSLARAFERGALGPVYTISRGGAVVLVYPLSVALFGEVPTTAAVVGSAIVLLGLVLSGIQPAPATAGPDRAVARGAIGWALVCAASIAGYHLAYKAALDAGGSPSAVFAVALTLATAMNIARTGRAGRREGDRAVASTRCARRRDGPAVR